MTAPGVAPPEAAILIFGAAVRPDGGPSATLRRRVEAAAAFGETLQPPPLYVPTGGQGRHGPAEAAVMAALLRARGVPPGRIAEEPTGTDTLSSVLACARLLRARGHAGPVFAATSAYHLPRCVLLLRLAGLPARAAPPPPAPAARAWRRRWYWRLRELPAIPWDAALILLARWRRRPEGPPGWPPPVERLRRSRPGPAARDPLYPAAGAAEASCAPGGPSSGSDGSESGMERRKRSPPGA
ncbi:hypothetical protein GCM10010964_05330 [Caldovatus sediminis]|uniref:DUF218 domain-containing protein n=1 Tax=Caldovatus sediminis TaxID=2041189 RepID=A0A8J3EAV7_9PROT|nr:YdcF family protein [Caldovatus sediminis]GGG20023.1 hypothetical protein GCM10010964_05330 [Caldovatus sediminis]